MYRVSQEWCTNGALRCRRDYRKRQKNVKKILLDLFSDLAVFKVGLNRSIILKYMYEIVMTATSNHTYYHKVQDHHYQYLILHNREFRSFGNRKKIF
jgi:hypothetical protein